MGSEMCIRDRLHDRDTCEKCSLALAWIKACNIEGFNKLENITKSCYVCSLHFLDGKPTTAHPIPTSISTGSFGKIITPRKPPLRIAPSTTGTSNIRDISDLSAAPIDNPTSSCSSNSPSKEDFKRKFEAADDRCTKSVSYTHLTLPTIHLVYI